MLYVIMYLAFYIFHQSSTYYTCTGDCDFCVKDDYHLTKLNPEIGTDLEYQFMCDYDFHFISYKGKVLNLIELEN